MPIFFPNVIMHKYHIVIFEMRLFGFAGQRLAGNLCPFFFFYVCLMYQKDSEQEKSTLMGLHILLFIYSSHVFLSFCSDAEEKEASPSSSKAW